MSDVSDEELFERSRHAQNEWLRNQLIALGKKPRKTREKHIDHEVRCADCSDVVIQVMSLDPYRIVRYRVVDVAADGKRHLEWKFTPIPDEPARSGRFGADRQYVITTCRCTREHTFTLGGILDRAARGRKSTITPHRDHPIDIDNLN